MSVVIETTLGDITVDLYTRERPKACRNFLKLCKMKYYNFNLFHTVERNFIAQTGDPTGSRHGGESIYGVIEGPSKRYFEAETKPPMKHLQPGLVSFVTVEENMIGSQFFITLAQDLTYLDQHCIFGEVVEGFDVLSLLNKAICNSEKRPFQDIRITHTVILDDPYDDLSGLHVPSRSPSPSAERLQGGLIPADEDIEEGNLKDTKEMEEIEADREAKARATILEMVGDIPDADMAPPENVLFVCKLNPVTTSDDLEIIFSRFGKINSCEVIRDKKTGDSLQYAFIEFDNRKFCEDAYFKMDNVLIDDRRIHVDFSQSVAKIKWLGKGKGVKLMGEPQAKPEKKSEEGKRQREPPRRYQDDYDKKNKVTKKRDSSRDRYYSKKRKERSKSRDRSRHHRENKDSDRSRHGRYERSDKHDKSEKYEHRSSYKEKKSSKEYSSRSNKEYSSRSRHEHKHRGRSRS